MEKVQLEVLTAELSRIEAEERKLEVEKEVLLLKKEKTRATITQDGFRSEHCINRNTKEL